MCVWEDDNFTSVYVYLRDHAFAWNWIFSHFLSHTTIAVVTVSNELAFSYQAPGSLS